MALSPDEAGLLAGVRVLEAASMIMVPSVGAVLADYGAQVIKLEPIEGDLNRRGHQIPGMPIHDYEYCFLPDNRGKRSLSIDLKAPEARAIVRRLVEGADIFLTNHRPKSLQSLGLGWNAAAGDQSASGVRARHRVRRRSARRSTSRASTRSATGRARAWRRTCFRPTAGWGRWATAPAIIRPAWRSCRRCCSRCSRANAAAAARGFPAHCSRTARGRTRS